MDGGAWRATVQGVTNSQTRLINLTFMFDSIFFFSMNYYWKNTKTKVPIILLLPYVFRVVLQIYLRVCLLAIVSVRSLDKNLIHNI